MKRKGNKMPFVFFEVGRFYDDVRNGRLPPTDTKLRDLLCGEGAAQGRRLLALFCCRNIDWLEFEMAVDLFDIPEEEYWHDRKPHLRRREGRSLDDSENGMLEDWPQVQFVFYLYECFHALEKAMPGKAAAIVDDLHPFAVAWMQMGKTWGDDACKELDDRIGALVGALVGRSCPSLRCAGTLLIEATHDAAGIIAETPPPPNPPAVTPSPAETWNGKTVGRLTVEEWGRRILWKPKRRKDAYKTPEPTPFVFTAPRIWAGLALILANNGGWTDMEEERRESGRKSKWKDAFKGERLTRLRDAVFESRAQDAPGTSRGQFWKLKD